MDRDEKEKLVLDFFLKNPDSFIQDIAVATNFSKSSVQRYLERYKDYVIPDRGITVGMQMMLNRDMGRKKGGITSFQNNEAIKDGKGRFQGSRKNYQEDKVECKKRDIAFLCNYYLDRYPITFREMAEELSDCGVFTKDYIYRCITTPNLEKIIGEDLALEVYHRLDSSRYSFDRKMSGASFDEMDHLAVRDAIVISLRRGNHSLAEVGKIMGVSKSTVAKWESKILRKVRNVK